MRRQDDSDIQAVAEVWTKTMHVLQTNCIWGRMNLKRWKQRVKMELGTAGQYDTTYIVLHISGCSLLFCDKAVTGWSFAIP